MSLDYLLGKDMASVQDSLRRVESRLDVMERRMTCRCRENHTGHSMTSKSNLTILPKGIPVLDQIDVKSGLVSVDWTATQDSVSRRAVTPDLKEVFVFFGFMLRRTDINVGIPDTISTTIWPIITDLNSKDLSASQYFGYRPTKYQADSCIIGYSNPSGFWNWCTIEFWHTEGGDCCFSWMYDRLGNPLWIGEPGKHAVLFTDINYKFTVTYADCDSEYGLAFNFDQFTPV
jgi:hypothetical protein